MGLEPPAIAAIRDPRGDPFELIPAFWATILLLPIATVTLLGAVSGEQRKAERARLALIAAGCLTILGLLLEILRRVSEATG